jgi:hypothetical protein
MTKVLIRCAFAVGVLILSQPAARAVDQDMLNKAIDAGVAHLKSSQQPEGNFGSAADGMTLGATSLIGLTLLECGVPADDACLKKATEFIRNAAVGETKTYSISLAILYLDKLRDPVDVALIESLTVRLLAGQNAAGGWSYDCPSISAEEAKRLGDLLKNPNQLTAKRNPKTDDTKRSPSELPKEIKDQLGAINRPGGINGGRPVAGGPGQPMPNVGFESGDNSNTQFATLALWVGRREGMPVEAALGRVAKRFRGTVNANHTWSYMSGPNGPVNPAGNVSEASMTCAGLLGLAISYGVASELAEEKVKPSEPEKDKPAKPKEVSVADIGKDPLVTNGLRALSTAVGQPVGKPNAANLPKIGGRSYYFLWSLERVCMALDIDTVGGKEWYEWGAEILLANQLNDGSWAGDHAQIKADTCFALLFLKRANFARDLSAKLRGKLDHKALRGGVGTEGIKEKIASGLTTAKEGDDKVGDPKENKPPSEAKEVERLTREVVDAKGEPQGKLLESLHQDKDRKYTEALLNAINQLSGEGKKGARKVLAERLSKEGKDKPDKLTENLGDRDSEMRRAAALACALNESKQHVPQLIGLLRDREALVSRAAWASLKNLTGQNFGPTADATDAEKDKAVEDWREWWKKNGGK